MTNETSLLESVSAPVFALASGRNGAFLAWNKALSQVTGINAVDAVGRTPVEVLGPLAAGVSLAPPGAVNVPGLGIAVLERHDGLLIGTLHDREREAFLGLAAHDLRTPLRNVLYLAEEAMVETQAAEKAEMLARIAKVARNGLEMTRDMVACAQSSGFGEQPRTLVELKPLADQIFATVDPERRHHMECDAAFLTVERPVLLTILRNLMDNAIRHGGGAERRIRIEAQPVEAGIQIRVSDNGKGFKDSALAFLSGGEFRAESGYGLVGLRRLIHARGGRFGVEPGDQGKGSAVVVTLPGSFGKGDEVAIAS